MGYIELESTSNFSFLCGASSPEELVAQAAQLGYPAIALSDHSTLSGIVRAHIAAKQHAIRLIVGSRIFLFNSARQKLPLSLLLYPRNKNGYHNLCELLTKGKRRSEKGKCHLFMEDLAQFTSDISAICCIHDINNRTLEPTLCALSKNFSPDSLYLRLTRTYQSWDDVTFRSIQKLSQKYKLPLIATNDVLYHCPNRRPLQDVLACIQHKTTINEAGYLLNANSERYLKPAQEMARLFRHLPEAIKNSEELSSSCTFSLDELKYEYPHEICPDGVSPIDYLQTLTYQCAKTRYPLGVPLKVAQTIERELQVVKELDYAKYFLTVYDIVQFARARNILCQGRGAAANSAICYALGITAVDPDKIHLLFDRFVSKERNEPPDIDIDFEHERREEVIQYIYEKYGRERAALVCEVISYRTKSALRDVGKAFGLSPATISRLLKAKRQYQDYLENELTKKQSPSLSIADFLAKNGLNQHNIYLHNTLSLASQLKSFPRHLSQHVGGFVISEQRLCSLVPIENATMEGRSVIEWDKDDIDAMGMLKIDLLSLGMLTCIRKALDLVNKQSKLSLNQSAPLLFHTIPSEDSAVYEMLCKADTIGVFQIESRAQMSMLPRLRPLCFYDLVIEVAIVRPGPLQGGIVHPFLRRRKGLEPITYPTPAIKTILERTLGVPIFQEQIMEISVVGAGFSGGQADQLRRALGSWRRNKGLIAEFGQKLVQGFLANHYPRWFIKQCLNQIKGFAEYGFPQSHAASFALLVYVSAWLKFHHPACFAAALLNSQPMGFYHPAQIVNDATKHGVEVLSIDVLHSSWDCTLEQHPAKLRLGLRLVKGLSKKDAEKLCACRERERPKTILSLWRQSGVSLFALKALARADAFRSLGKDRQSALWEIQRFKNECLPLFENLELKEENISLPQIADSLHVQLDYVTTGLSLKAHPLSFLRTKLDSYAVIPLNSLHDKSLTPNGLEGLFAGMVIVRQQPHTANGMVFFTVEDETALGNLVVKAETFRRLKETLVESNLLLIKGHIQRADNVTSIIVQDALSLDHAFHKLTGVSRDFH